VPSRRQPRSGRAVVAAEAKGLAAAAVAKLRQVHQAIAMIEKLNHNTMHTCYWGTAAAS
jgi:hypothetical protein